MERRSLFRIHLDTRILTLNDSDTLCTRSRAALNNTLSHAITSPMIAASNTLITNQPRAALIHWQRRRTLEVINRRTHVRHPQRHQLCQPVLAVPEPRIQLTHIRHGFDNLQFLRNTVRPLRHRNQGRR